ncbi:hypothetical protein C8E95_6315 [Pseudonocardia autotrophica]|uniref:Uncharacterized protein n=2 Tax=Pseudonocardia TaxID=1847 RepID=A0A1Y2MTE3_PSEAH|nr:hypothetical protein BG845_03982 [Pseudonocardia autotrophica]TDN77091.1 hypothetical protein C8E95_6315 [Pseudonocardia autotrophica]BBG01097.1 hypothetical protein Pdca_23060 [Pseudonocardia autotrophica]GEC28790.1 hypothetical protein PSA01_58190 [Pseudonocardia saturnea]
MLSAGSPRTGADRRPVIRWDVALSGIALALTGMLVALGVFGGIFLMAFLDYCPPKTCSSSRILVSVAGSLVVAAAAGIAGLAMTVLRIVERRVSWPFALITLAIVATAIGFGAADYTSAIGY